MNPERKEMLNLISPPGRINAAQAVCHPRRRGKCQPTKGAGLKSLLPHETIHPE
jgi:hypothetical protein